MHDVGKTCMHDACASKVCSPFNIVLCLFSLKPGEIYKCMLSFVALCLFHFFPCLFIVDLDGSAVTPTQTKVSRNDLIFFEQHQSQSSRFIFLLFDLLPLKYYIYPLLMKLS